MDAICDTAICQSLAFQFYSVVGFNAILIPTIQLECVRKRIATRISVSSFLFSPSPSVRLFEPGYFGFGEKLVFGSRGVDRTAGKGET